MAKTTTATNEEIVIYQTEQGVMDFFILGQTPLILRRMAQKGLQELLMPKGRKTAAEKASQLKHDPVAEYRESPYVVDDDGAMLGLMTTSFKNAMKTAALDLPGAKKSQIGRLVYVEGALTPIYGKPEIFMSVTRSADMNRTPDVRTRMILREWACRLSIRFVKPILREQSIANLLAAAGFQSGVGDWRQEKGSGNYGCFKLVSADDADWNRIVATQGRDVQQEGIDNPVAYDRETEELLSWFDIEVKRRGFKVAA